MNVKVDMQRSVPRNFVDHLRMLAVARPEDVALVVAGERDGTPVDKAISYGQLDARVRALAAVLQQQFQPEDRALLLLDNNDHYVVAFFACLYAGLIAVPVFPPESAREQYLERLKVIARDSRARCVLTSSDITALAGPAMSRLGGADPIAVDTIDPANADRWVPQFPVEDAIAFLQYTSGSTSTPKGVMVSHGNLMANERVIQQALEINSDDVFVSWLPLFHDMGLIGGLLQPIYRGIKLVLMSPSFFLQRPVRWLETISRHGGTISGGPDFAYRLCVDRIKNAQLASLDLSCWRIAFSGAEPVRHDTLSNFTARFSAVGFRASAVNPCYGLAEATLMVTAAEPGAGMVATVFQDKGLQRGDAVPDPTGKTLVACGGVVTGHRVSIRNSQAQTSCDPGSVGEIWACGPSIAKGYWNKPRETAESFIQRDGATWLRTGDLGFIHEGRLYVAGRVKDLIIVRGQNLYPQDIERAVENEVDAVRKSRVAAFAVDGPDSEGIGIAAEVSRGLQKLVAVDRLVEALSVAVSEACGEPLSVAVLLNPGALPKTSSGKLQRRACRQGWLDQTLDAYAIYEHDRFVLGGSDAVATTEPELDDVEMELAKNWAAALGDRVAKKFDHHTHFFAAGGNSLAATRVMADIEARWKVAFPVRLLFEFPRLAECATELRRRLTDGSHTVAQLIPVLPADQRNQPLPLSPAQQRQWFLWKLDSTGTAYHIQGALRIRGQLNRDALAAAVAGLAQRHESLRTVFSERADGEAEQRIEGAGRLTLQFADLRDSPDAEAKATDILQRLNGEPFDLAVGPLARMILIRVAEAEHILAMVMHHIIADGVSMQILVDELGARYAAAVNDKQLDLPRLSVQYADYTLWQRQWLESGERERQLSYWRDQLRSGSEPLRLPTHYPRRAVAHYRAGQHDFQLPDTLSAKLCELAENAGTTLLTVLLTGFQVLLYRYAGQPDIRIGVPVANRSRAEIQNVVGFFVNTLVLRNVFDGRMPLSQVLQQAATVMLDAQTHQDLPFNQLVEALQPERSLSHNPLFQVMFNHLREDYRVLQSLPGGLSVGREPFASGAAQFELSLDTREDVDGRLRASFIYARELFVPGIIERMAGHYLAVLRALAEEPEQGVSDVDLLTEAERQQLTEWGINDKRYPNTEPIHRLIEQRVKAHPSATALIFGDEHLTYGALNVRANRLAHHLIRLGVKPEVKIGIAVERSIEMVVGLLAIFKAGGAYVPLDPEYPTERLDYMIEDSGIELLLTQRPIKDSLPTKEGLPVLELDNLDLSGESAGNPKVEAHGDNLAYVIYTSGSTGKPKGVMVRHGALSHFLLSMQQQPGLTENDILAAVTSLLFDIAALELYLPLISGARTVIASREEARDGEALARLIEQSQATVLQCTPASWRLLLAVGWSGVQDRPFKGLCGGEALQPDLADNLRNISVELWNMYGPTETTIWSTISPVSDHVSLGRAIGDTQLRVLDGAMNATPIGVPGELYLGGIGLARGYLNRQALSAERFVADPFDEQGGRLYRTGDLVRWNSEDQLEYLGRIDHQVKIRGFRIELGEVEAQLLAQPEVREAVVVAQERPMGTRLVAYVTAGAEHTINAVLLRERLAASLPDYMVPSAIVVLESLPLNANGKVDRKALPEAKLTPTTEYEPPQGELEKTLEQIWADVLEVERVGRHDNFFDLGGHSLQLIRVHRLLEDRLHADLSVVDLFKYPTVDALAKRIGQTPDQHVPTVSSRVEKDLARRRRTALLQRKRFIERIS